MKYIAFIVLGLVLLATIGGIVLWANMPTAKLAVHAVRPTGADFTWDDGTGKEHSSAIWEIAITNRGSAPALWTTQLELHDGAVYGPRYGGQAGCGLTEVASRRLDEF